jgi:hypothetical protein
MFADLHNHPLARAYNAHRNSFVELNNDGTFHGWNIPPSRLRKIEKGKRAFAYCQCDLARLTKARVRLVFASLYPLEKGFVIGKKDIVKKFAHIDNDEERAKKIDEAVNDKAARTILRDLLQSNRMRMTEDRINFLQSSGYDYFNELQKEYAFYLIKNGIDMPLKDFKFEKGLTADITGKYRLARNGQDVSEVLHGDPDDIAIVLTIEGMHALGVGNPQGYGEDITTDLLKERIRSIKGESPGGWQYPVFFITFSHHFSNRLCGHAHSIPGDGAILLNQKEDMDEGFLNNGLEIAQALLGLDKDLNDTGSRRILLDVKHMSAKGRWEYYNKIVKPYNLKNPARKIPVIASHVGYSGCETLQELIDNTKDEKNNTSKDHFLFWNINLSDDDIAEIHNSGGLIGMSFDQRVLGLEQTLLTFLKLPRNRLNNINGFMRMLERVVSVPFKRQLVDPAGIWNTLTIGTDYDGFIDPVDPYPTVLSFDLFRRDLEDALRSWRRDSRAALLGELNVEKVVEGICFRNAYEFVKKHYV